MALRVLSISKNQALEHSAKAYVVENWYYLEEAEMDIEQCNTSLQAEKGNYGQH